MKAMVRDAYCAPDDLQLTDIDTPAIGDDDVLVRVRAAGVDQSAWHLVTGLPYAVRLAGYGLRRPKSRVPGVDIAGVVEVVGRGVTRFRPGDEVFGAGAGSFAELTRASAKALQPKPANLTFEQAAAVPTSGFTALRALRDKGRVEAGQRVLVIGAGGGVGSFAVQLATVFGAAVTGVCGPSKVELVRSLGADEVVDYTREDFTGPYDLIVDTAGNRSLRRLRRALTRRGTLVIVGGRCEGRLVQGADRQLRASLWSPFVPQSLGGVMAKERPEDLALLRGLIVDGRVTPAVSRTYPLHDLPEAIRYVREGHAAGKVAVTI